MKPELPITRRRLTEKLVSYAREAPKSIEGLSPGDQIRLLRNALRMTQAQLAKRVGLPQSHIAKMESGKVDLNIKTLRRVLDALFCNTLLIPQPRRRLEDILRDQTRKAAQRKVSRVAGNMALEKQRPDEKMLQDLIIAEEERLARSESSEIWEE
jgi:predicted DNA-binding mobile mystery protein A